MAGVDAQRQVEGAGFFVDREEVRVGDIPVEVEAALEDAAGAVLLRPAQLVHRLFGLKQRQHGRPVKAPVGLRTFLCQPAVVGRGQRPLRFGVLVL